MLCRSYQGSKAQRVSTTAPHLAWQLAQVRWNHSNSTGLAEALAACRGRFGENTRAASACLDESTTHVCKSMPCPNKPLRTTNPVTQNEKTKFIRFVWTCSQDRDWPSSRPWIPGKLAAAPTNRTRKCKMPRLDKHLTCPVKHGTPQKHQSNVSWRPRSCHRLLTPGIINVSRNSSRLLHLEPPLRAQRSRAAPPA